MRLAVIRTLFLNLLRDRSALAMAFILPPIFFAVFASIFANTTSGDLRVKTAIAVPDTQMGRYFASGMGRIESLDIILTATTEAPVRRAVRLGQADAGLIVRVGEDEKLEFEIVSDPSRRIAERMVEGAVAEMAGRNAPQTRLQEAISFLQENVITFTPDQQRAIGEQLSELDPADIDLGDSAPSVTITPVAGAVSSASYYAIAVAMLFLFLSSLQGALTLIESRESGIFDRLAVSPGGPAVVVDGSFAFLTLQGLVQGAIIFALGWLAFDVPVLSYPGVIFAIVLCAALAAGGITLAIVALCQTRRQAHSIGTILILLMAALGGSMAPRILMPETFQKIGGLTPNAWGIEAFSGVVIRGGDVTTILPWCVALALTGVAGMLVARLAVNRY